MAQTKDPLNDGGSCRVDYGSSGASSVRSSEDSSRIRSEIEQTRSRMDLTMSEIAEQLHPRHLLNEVLDLFRGGDDGAEARRTAKKVGRKVVEKVQEHPVGSALIGAGLAYMMFIEDKDKDTSQGLGFTPDEMSKAAGLDVSGCGCGTAGEYVPGMAGSDISGIESESQRSAGTRVQEAAGSALGAVKDAAAGAAKGVGHAATGAAHGVSRAASAAAEKVGNLAGKAREGLAQAKDQTSTALSNIACQVGDKARDLGQTVSTRVADAGYVVKDRAVAMGHQVRHGYDVGKQKAAEVSSDYPLAVGAAVFSLGLIVGLALPRTRKEDELIGEQAEGVKGRARQRGKELVSRGMHIAQVTAEQAVDEAKRQGLTPSALIDKAKRVASEVQNVASDVAQREEITPSSLGEKVKAVAGQAKEAAKQEMEQDQNQGERQNLEPSCRI